MRFTITLLPLAIISCLPTRLVPIDFDIKKNNTQAFIELDSLTIALENLEVKGDHLVFGLEIENRGSQPVFVNRDKIRKYASKLSYREEKSFELYQQVSYMMSPDQVNEFFKTKKENAEAAAFMLFILGAAISTMDAIQDAKDDKKTEWTSKDQLKSNARDAATAATLIATDVLGEVAMNSSEVAKTELNYLPRELFDRAVIYPSESYFGKILFRKYGSLKKYHRIHIPIEGKNLYFDFRKPTLAEQEFLSGGY